MADVLCVAEYILHQTGFLTATKLQQLVYYCQAWHLVWTEQPLFEDKIEAWRSGPVVPNLFKHHKGHLKLHPGFFFTDKSEFSLSDNEKEIIDRVLDYYGHRDPHWLSQLSHMEDPWKNARSIHPHTDQHHDHPADEISLSSIFEYYNTLQRS